MKQFIIAATIVIAGVGTSTAEPATGVWQTERGDSGAYLHVDIAPCGAKLCGTVIRVLASEDRSSVGKPIIWDMNAKGGGRYAGGKIWAPDTDKTYRSKMSLEGDALTVSGCFGPICRAQVWLRLK